MDSSTPTATSDWQTTQDPKPLVAVVFTHNDAATIERCLTSVAECTAAIWVVDTGSTDNTLTLARQWASQVMHEPAAGDPWTLWQRVLNALKTHYPQEAWIIWLEPTDWLPTQSQQTLERWIRLESQTAQQTGQTHWKLPLHLHHWNGTPLHWGGWRHHDLRLGLLNHLNPDDHPLYCGWVSHPATPSNTSIPSLHSVVIHHQSSHANAVRQHSHAWQQAYQTHQYLQGQRALLPHITHTVGIWFRQWVQQLGVLNGPEGIDWFSQHI
ncbi:MAG: glycosyltransferase family 2 protein [Vampirovibrionales bacterium]